MILMVSCIIFREESVPGHPGADFGHLRTKKMSNPFSEAHAEGTPFHSPGMETLEKPRKAWKGKKTASHICASHICPSPNTIPYEVGGPGEGRLPGKNKVTQNLWKSYGFRTLPIFRKLQKHGKFAKVT